MAVLKGSKTRQELERQQPSQQPGQGESQNGKSATRSLSGVKSRVTAERGRRKGALGSQPLPEE